MAELQQRPDLAAYEAAYRMSPAELVGELRPLLGDRLIAYLGRVKETRAVRGWADGSRQIAAAETIDRLRIAYRIARMICERDSPEVVQAWMQGLNPLLEDRAPALLLRDGDMAEVGPDVLAAARQFVAVG